MSVWWITEAINIYFTSLLPVIFFPLFGILSIDIVAPAYMPQIIFLFIGGFFLAFALEKWKLHQRIALYIILKLGKTPEKLLLSFMFSSYFLSMWILNTATVMMLLPAVLAVIAELNKLKPNKKLATPFLLGIAYASSIGGTATIIGTAPNMYFMEFFNQNIAQVPIINFANWFAFAFPISLVFFGICYIFLKFKYRFVFKNTRLDVAYCKNQYQLLGKISFEEKIVLMLTVLAILGWFTMRDIKIGSLTFYGWSNLFPNPSAIKESSVALFISFLLMVIPSKKDKKKNILSWKDAEKLPYGILLLFGGGFALAKGISTSGLGIWFSQNLLWLTNFHPAILILGICVFTIFFTELTSNTAAIALLLPLLASVGNLLGNNILPIMLGVTLTCSYAFMLPVATPPNTIVFASNQLQIKQMVNAGFWLNVVGVCMAFAAAYFWSSIVF